MPGRASPACSPARKFSVVHLLVHSLSMMRSGGGVARVLRSRDHRDGLRWASRLEQGPRVLGEHEIPRFAATYHVQAS